MASRISVFVLALAGLLAVRSEAREPVMFFGAHPDDFESCVGLALRMKADYDIRIVDFTRGEGGLGEAGFRDGTAAERRMAEERAVAKAFDSEPIFLSAVNFQGCYAYANEKVTAEIEALLLKLRPKAVFVHWPVDEHPDHVQCAAAVQHALWNVRRDHRFKPELYFYNSPPWQTKNYVPTYYVDVTDQVDRMTEIISRYVCQDGPKLARNKRERMKRQGAAAPVPVAYAECYATFSGKPDPACILARYAIVGASRTTARPIGL